MACEFHHYLGRDADGEHEADEGLSAGVGGHLGVFGADDVVSAAVLEAGDADGFVDVAELADLLQVGVHALVGDDGQREVSGEILVLVLVQDGLGVGVELDVEGDIGLLGGDGEDAVLDVVAVDVGHVGVAEAGEGAEAEEVAGLSQGAGLQDGFFDFPAGHVVDLDFLAGLRQLEVVQAHQLFVGEEDDGLAGSLEDGMVGGHVGQMGVAVGLAPVEEGHQVLVLLFDGAVFHSAFEAKVIHEGCKALFVEVAEGALLVELLHVLLEGFVHLGGLEGPADFAGAFPPILIQIAVGGWGGFLHGFFLGFLRFFLQGLHVRLSFVDGGQVDVAGVEDLLEFGGQHGCGGGLRQGEFVVGEVVGNLAHPVHDLGSGEAGFVLVAFREGLGMDIELGFVDVDADALLDAGAADEE